jgi:hypothetical protein
LATGWQPAADCPIGLFVGVEAMLEAGESILAPASDVDFVELQTVA